MRRDEDKDDDEENNQAELHIAAAFSGSIRVRL
jgi:hypothetical protein